MRANFHPARGVRVCAKTVIGVTAAPTSEYFIVIIVIPAARFANYLAVGASGFESVGVESTIFRHRCCSHK